MFDYYEKLFPSNLRYTPYNNDNEHIWDRIKFLDMRIYDLLIDEKENKDNNNDFINEFLFTYRISDNNILNDKKENRIRILEFLNEYIKDREDASIFAQHELSLLRIESAFNMYSFSKTCLIMALAYELNRKYRNIYSFINNEKSDVYPTAYIALKLCNINTEVYSDVIPCIAELKIIRDYIFENKNLMMIESKNDITAPLKLNEKVQKILIKSSNINYKIFHYFEIFKYKDELEELEFNHYIKEDIVEASYEIENIISYKLYSKSKIIFLKGLEGVGKRFYIKHALKELKRNVLFIDISALINEKDEAEELKQDILKECLMENAVPCLYGLHKIYQLEKYNSWILKYILMELKNITELIFITSEEEIHEINFSDTFNIKRIDIENPYLNIRSEYLKNCMKNKNLTTKADINILLNKFSFTPGQIKAAIYDISCKTKSDKMQDVSEEDIYDVFNSLAFSRLSDLAVSVKPIYKWNDLVLKKEQKETLKQACDHIKFKHIVYEEWGFYKKRTYGNGVCILFAGSPGTGKTMAAQVVANELHINMYKVDLSQITSKYIGETEKNLKKLFDEAKKSNSLLFFDEADTIFAKRTEVKDSHDKHSNMDAAYLLQKIEEYDGISVLATNYIQNIDEAFIRRISFIIRFSMPELYERKEIWMKSFPDSIPIYRAIDFDFLASKFQLSGSNIKNIVLHSAFLAASNNEGISMKHIINAIKAQYLKVNKILLKEDLGPYFEN